MKIAIVTDSNSGMTAQEAQELGVQIVPMPFSIDGQLYYGGVDLTQEEFFRRVAQGADVSTSQPAPGEVGLLWARLLEEYDQLVYIPMSSGLSNACATARLLAQEAFPGKAFVVDNKRISVTQWQSVRDAVALAKLGFDGAQIQQKLEEDALNASIYIMVDTLKYLKKGGRITPAAAAIGAVLNVKPVLQIQGEKLDAFAKVRGAKAAQQKLIDALRHDLDTRFAGKRMMVAVAYSGSPEAGEAWRQQVQEAFPQYEVFSVPLTLSVACHTGPGALGVGCIQLLDLPENAQ